MHTLSGIDRHIERIEETQDKVGVSGTDSNCQIQNAKKPQTLRSEAFSFLRLVHQAGFEPTTTAFGGQYSIQLSYWCNAGAMILICTAGVHAAESPDFSGR